MRHDESDPTRARSAEAASSTAVDVMDSGYHWGPSEHIDKASEVGVGVVRQVASGQRDEPAPGVGESPRQSPSADSRTRERSGVIDAAFTAKR
jgi:hypothetical protein